MGVAPIIPTNNAFSTTLKAYNYGVSLNSNALAKLPSSSTNYLIHMVLDKFALETYPNPTINLICSPYSLLFMDSSFKPLNNALTNISRDLQISFIDYNFNGSN